MYRDLPPAPAAPAAAAPPPAAPANAAPPPPQPAPAQPAERTAAPAAPAPAEWNTQGIPWLEEQIGLGRIPTREELEQIRDPEARRAVAAAEAWRREEAAKIEQQRAEIEAAKHWSAAQLRAAADERANALAFTRSDSLRAWWDDQTQQLPAQPPHPDDPAYAEYAGRMAALKVVQSMLGVLTQEEQRATQLQQQAQAAQQFEQVREQLTDYIEQNFEDFEDPELLARIEQLSKQYRMPVPEAHRLAVSERAVGDQGFDAVREQSREVGRRRVRTGGRPVSTVPEVPNQFRSATERDEWYQAHPEAISARLEYYRKNGVGY